jgi:hypothetical protein
VRTNVHVPERPDWVFVKLFAHGASTPGDVEAVVGSDFEDALSYLERAYNDGTRYVLHYITAREAYNLARAASEGATGAPDQYLDAYVPPYEANTKNRPFAPAWQYVDAPLSRSHPVNPKHSTERAAPNEKSQNACNVRASHRRTITKILRTRSD